MREIQRRHVLRLGTPGEKVTMAIEIRVRNKCEVNAYRNGVMTAKALRATELHKWQIGKLFSRFSSEDGSTATFFDIVGEIGPPLGEVEQRKAIRAILKAIA